MRTKNIAILSLGIGAGHLRAAEVIHRALYDGGEDIEARTMDALDDATRWFDWVYVRPYWWMLWRAPWLWRWTFERRLTHHHHATAPAWVFRHGCRKALNQLKAMSPHLVIATEVGAAELAALGRREGVFSAPILAVQTDFVTEPPWFQPEIDFYCVGSEEAKRQLTGWGVSSHRIVTCGIPVDPAFALRFDRAEVMKALGLEARRPVILVMGGGMGPAPLDEIVRSLERCGQPVQVLAVAGRNREVRLRLEQLRGRVALDLHIFGWTENIPELMAAADVLITKPGGLTTSEALAAGLPMVLTHPIPGPEERHLHYLTGLEVAVGAPTLADIPKIISALLREPQRLKAMSQRARELARPDAADGVAQVARALLDKETFIDLLAAPPSRSGESAYLM